MCKVLPFGGELSCQANTNSMLPTPATTRCVASPGSKALATTLVALAKRSIHASRIMYRAFALAMQQALIKRPAPHQTIAPPSSLPQWILPPSALARPFTPEGRCKPGGLIISHNREIGIALPGYFSPYHTINRGGGAQYIVILANTLALLPVSPASYHLKNSSYICAQKACV